MVVFFNLDNYLKTFQFLIIKYKLLIMFFLEYTTYYPICIPFTFWFIIFIAILTKNFINKLKKKILKIIYRIMILKPLIPKILDKKILNYFNIDILIFLINGFLVNKHLVYFKSKLKNFLIRRMIRHIKKQIIKL